MYIYLMNSAVITAEGTYRYRILDPYEAYRLFNEYVGNEEVGHVVKSAVGYEQTAKYMSKILKYDVTVNREQVTLGYNDMAIVCKLKYRVQDPTTKGQTTEPDYEWGILERLTD